MTHVLLVSNEPVGTRMAGPGIRYCHFAAGLAPRFDVTLVVPNEPDVELPGVRVVHAHTLGLGRFARLARDADVVVAQQLSIGAMQRLALAGVRIVYDLYDPLLFEALGFHAGETDGTGGGAELARAAMLKQIVALATGSAFLCASERQRDLWLGMLSVLGRIGLDEYREDPALERLVRVVPFGIEPEPPAAERRVLKGVVPGIGEDDRVLLWGGGVWNWLDPLTPIRATARLARTRPEVKLYFLGIRHPSPRVADMAMARRALALAEELGVLGTHVHANEGWTPYAERAAVLLEADLGISAQFATVESRFALRTRVLDYLWGGLPVVATRGDALGDLVGERGLGRAVEPEAVDEWVEAVESLLFDPAAYEAARARVADVREEFLWPRVVAGLADLLEQPLPPARFPPRATPAVLRYLWSGLSGSIRRRGAVKTARDALELLRRPDVP